MSLPERFEEPTRWNELLARLYQHLEPPASPRPIAAPAAITSRTANTPQHNVSSNLTPYTSASVERASNRAIDQVRARADVFGHWRGPLAADVVSRPARVSVTARRSQDGLVAERRGLGGRASVVPAWWPAELVPACSRPFPDMSRLAH